MPAVDLKPSADELLWDVINGSQDAKDFKRYLQRYPDGLHAGLAEKQLHDLQAMVGGCDDLSGEWRAWLQGADKGAVKMRLAFVEQAKTSTILTMRYAVPWALLRTFKGKPPMKIRS